MAERRMVAGRYRIGDLLGEGGMGAVYRGTDTQTGDPVALKLLKSDLVARNPEMVERFTREGEALRLLNHPNIVKMLAALHEDGQHYIVMEYVGGGSLYDLLHDVRTRHAVSLPVSRVLEIALELADALTRAHHLNIIHRDLKPANVLLVEDGTPRLSDFGIAYMQTRARVTETDSVVGTLSYLSPEALRGEGIDARTDLWAFGVMLFEMLAGKHPFERTGAPQTMMAIVTEPPPDLESQRPDVPLGLVDLVYRMLEKDRNQRIPSARQVGAALEAILRGHDTSAMAGISKSPKITFADTGRFDTPILPPDAVKHNLPKQPTPFVGREHELAQLAKLLDDPHIHLITISAPGGMGKTRLALQAAEALVSPSLSISMERGQGGEVNGVYLVQLAPLTSPEHIVLTIADAVGFQFYPGGEPKQELLDYFREKSLLLMLDNFEHLLEGAELVSDILQTAPQVKIIATSRERLNLRGETVFTIGGMDFPDWQTPEEAMQYSAVKLFLQSAQRVQPDLELEADDLNDVARLCRLVYGMPLAIELAASWVEMLPLAEIADEISKSLDFLESELRDLPERHRSLRAVFEYTWNLLDEEEKATFARVAVFRGGFSRQAAQTVTGATLKQLMALANKSLLRRDPDSGVYQVHELLRQYADEKHLALGTAHMICEAHSDYYLNALYLRQRDLEGVRQLEALKEIESDIENVRAAWLWAAKNGVYERLDTTIHSLWLYYRNRGLHQDGEAIFEQASDELKRADPDSQRDAVLGHLAARQAYFNIVLYEHQKSDRLLDESEKLLSACENLEAKAFLAWMQGSSNSEWKEQVDARPFFQKALSIYRELGSRWGEAMLLVELGYSYWSGLHLQEMNLREAEQLFQRALAIQQELHDLFGMVNTINGLSIVAAIESDLDKSTRLFLQALDLAHQSGKRYSEGIILGNLGTNLRLQHRYGEARHFFEHALTIRRELGTLVPIVWALGGLGTVSIEQGDFASAHQYFYEAVQLLKDSAERNQWVQDNLYGMGWAAWAGGDYDEAADYFQQSNEIHERKGKRGDQSSGYMALGEVALTKGDLAEARAQFNQGLAIAHEFNLAHQAALCRKGLGEVACRESNYPVARELLGDLLAYFRTEEAWKNASAEAADVGRPIVEIMSALADIERSEGQYAAARQLLMEALSLTTTKIVPHAFKTLAGIADLLAADSQLERAVEFASLVHYGPKAFVLDRTRAARTLESLKSLLASDVFAAAQERGKSLELEAVVAELLAENSGPNKSE